MRNQNKPHILLIVMFLLAQLVPISAQDYPLTLENGWVRFVINDDALTIHDRSSGANVTINKDASPLGAFLFVENRGLWFSEHFATLDETEIHIINPYELRSNLLFRHKQAIFEVSGNIVIKTDVSKFIPLGDYLYQNDKGEVFVLARDFLGFATLQLLEADGLNLDATSFRPLVMGYYADDNGLYFVNNHVIERVRDSRNRQRGILNYHAFFFDRAVFTSGTLGAKDVGYTTIEDMDLVSATIIPINNIGDEILSDGKVKYIRHHHSSYFVATDDVSGFPHNETMGENITGLCSTMESYLKDQLNIDIETLKVLGNSSNLYLSANYLIKNSCNNFEANVIEVDLTTLHVINRDTLLDKDNIYTLAGSRGIKVMPRKMIGIKTLVVIPFCKDKR